MARWFFGCGAHLLCPKKVTNEVQRYYTRLNRMEKSALRWKPRLVNIHSFNLQGSADIFCRAATFYVLQRYNEGA